jgi:hypothetical protein
VRLIACGECRRHVRENEATCPFCGADVAAIIAATPRWNPPKGLSRAAVVALAAATFGATACDEVGPALPAYGAPPGYVVHYGAPIFVDASTAVDAGSDAVRDAGTDHDSGR